MSKQRNDSGKKGRKPKRKGVPLVVYIPEDLSEALTTYVESCDPEISKRAAVISGLKMLLRSKGFWNGTEKDDTPDG